MKTNPTRPSLASAVYRTAFLLVFSLALTAADVRAQSPVPSIATGEDWTFPYTVTPNKYSGLYSMDGSQSGLVKHRGKTLWWEMLNPTEGNYDFSTLETELNNAVSGDYLVIFRLKCSILNASPAEAGNMTQSVPQWVVTKYGLDPTYKFSVGSGKTYIAPWHPGVQAEFRKFVLEIGRRGYLQHPALMAVYLHGVSSSSGEEMGVNSGTSAASATATALGFPNLAAAIMDCWTKRMDWWKQAAGDHVYKIAWVGAGSWSGISPDYDRNGLDHYALDLGMGKRHGFLEHYFYTAVHPPHAGQSYTSGYVESDWSAQLRDGRYWGDENEEFDEYGANTATKVRDMTYRSSFFRAAQLGMNFLWTASRSTPDVNGDYRPVEYASNENPTAASSVNNFNPTGAASLPLWFTLVAGKGAADSPDAAVWLREAEVRAIPGASSPAAWKNMERLIVQRDVTGAVTQPAELYAMPYVQLKPNADNNGDGVYNGLDYDEHTARRTDIGTGNRSMVFKLDPVFRSSLGSQAVKVKVTYLDSSATTWEVKIAKGASAPITLGSVTQTNPGTPTWKTATFTLATGNAPIQPGGVGSPLGDGVDLAIYVPPTSSANVVVRYVRVVRTEPANIAPTIKAQPRAQNVTLSTDAALHVVAKGTEPFSYQWTLNGTNISGATAATLALTNAQAATAGTYAVTVSNAYGSVTSADAQVQILDAGLLIDEFDDGNTTAPAWAVASGGTGNNPSITTSNTAPLSPDGSYYANLAFNAAAQWKYVVLDKGIFGARWQERGATAIRFYLKGNAAYSALPNNKLKLQIREGLNGERWSFDLGSYAKVGSWQTITAPFSAFYLDAGGSASGDTGQLDLELIDQIRFFNDSYTSAITVAVDRIEVFGYTGILDDFADGNAVVPYWWPTAGGSGNTPTIATSNTAPLSADGTYYANAGYNNANTWKYLVLAEGTPLFGTVWTFNGVTTLRFQLKGNTAYTGLANTSLKLQLREGEAGERWSYDLGNAAKASSSWQTITVPITSFYADGGSASGDTGQLDLELIDQVRLFNNNYTSPITIGIDGLQVLQQ